MLRPKYLMWIVSTTHTIPQLVAQEVEKGFVMGVRLEPSSSGWVDYLRVRCLLEATLICLQFTNGLRSCERILKVEKGGNLFLFEACGTGIQNVETSNGVLIDWLDNLAVGGGYEVDYKKFKSSASHFKGENGRVFGRTPTNLLYPNSPLSTHLSRNSSGN